MVFVFEFKFLDSNKNHEKYNLTFQNMLSLKMIFQTSYILCTWPPIQNYFCCPCHGQSSVRYIFFVIATATLPKNVIATVIATFLKKVIATLLANFYLNHCYIFTTFSLLLLFKIEKKNLTYNF